MRSSNLTHETVNASKKRQMEPGLRVYAIGDIHGRYDLLLQLNRLIAKHMEENKPARTVELFLGDYIDRGPNSREVIEHLIHVPPTADERICLRGNHEQTLLDFLADPERLAHWARYGGLEMMRAYDVDIGTSPSVTECHMARAQFKQNFPEDHLAFIENLPSSAAFGGYFFAHAGARPGVPLEEQDSYDLMWIRDDFLHTGYEFGKLIVHGHTPGEKPEFRSNRINIDTAAFATGVLTCLVLEGESQLIIATD